MKTRRLLALLMTVAMLLSMLGTTTALADDEVMFDEPDVIELPDGGLLEEDGEGLLSGLSMDLVTEDIDPRDSDRGSGPGGGRRGQAGLLHREL